MTLKFVVTEITRRMNPIGDMTGDIVTVHLSAVPDAKENKAVFSTGSFGSIHLSDLRGGQAKAFKVGAILDVEISG